MATSGGRSHSRHTALLLPVLLATLVCASSAQQLSSIASAAKSVLTAVPKGLSTQAAKLPENFSAEFGLFANAAVADSRFYIRATSGTPEDPTWQAGIAADVSRSTPWVALTDTKPANDESGWLFHATITLTGETMAMRIGTTKPFTLMRASAESLGLDAMGVAPEEEGPSATVTYVTINVVLNRANGKIKEFGFDMNGNAFSLASMAALLGFDVADATNGITLGSPSFSIELPDNSSRPSMVEVGGTVSAIPFLPASTYIDATVVIRPRGYITVETATNVQMFGGAITLNAFSIAVNSTARPPVSYPTRPINCTTPAANGTTPAANGTAPAANCTAPAAVANTTAPAVNTTRPAVSNTTRFIYASVVVSCPDAGITRAAGSLTYNDGAVKVSVEGLGSILDGKITLNQLMLDYGKNGTYIAGAAAGGLAGYVGAIAVNVSTAPAANGKRPTSFALTLPEVNVGTVVRAIGPTADRLLPDFVKNTNLPKMLLETTDKVTGTGNRTNITTTYHVAVGPHSTTGVYADFVFDTDGILVGRVAMEKSLDLGAAVSLALSGSSLPVDIRNVIFIREPYVSMVSRRARARGMVSNDTQIGTSMGFGLSIPAIMGEGGVVAASMLLMDGNETRVGNFEISWEGSFSPVRHVTLTNAMVSFQRGKGTVVTANGTLANIQIAAVLEVPTGNNFTLMAEARNVQVASALKTLFPSTPDLIVKVLDPVRFSSINFGYNKALARFTCEASPDLTGVPGLRELIGYLGFKQDDIKVRPKPTEAAIEIAIVKSWELRMGGPFVGPASLDFVLAMSQTAVNTKFAAKADFAGQMRLPFLEPEVIWVGLGATVAYDSTAPPPSVSFTVRAAVSATTNPFYIKGFPWVKVSYIGGEIGLTPIAPPPFVSLYKVALGARGTVLSTEVDFALMWYQPTADFAVQFSLQNLDLQRMINEMGIRANLGPFNILVRDARMSFSRAAMPLPSGGVIPAGFKLGADIEFMTIGAKLDVLIDSTGFEAYFEVRDVTRARIIAEALAKAQKVLDALKINVELAKEIRLDLVRVQLVLRTTRVAFRFGVKAYLFGVDINFDIVLDTANTPWDQVLQTLSDKFIEPLTAACTKDSYTRGSSFVDRCPAGQERQGDFCYPTCPTTWQYGATGRTNICYQNCPPGYKDDGVGGTGLTCSQIACNPGQIWDGALICWNACNAGYTYKATRCYKNCPTGWYDDPAGLSCQRNTCEGNDEDNGAGMCYPACAAGYTSNKLTMCIQSSCPDGYRNDPLSCWRGSHTYGKCCCSVFSKSCCGVCNPGYTDTGCTCYRSPSTIWKKTYDRGTGYAKFRTYVKDSYLDGSTSALRSFTKQTQWRDTKPLVCGPDKDYDGAAICYDKCAAGYTGKAFVCWQSCPANQGLIDCGTYCAPRAAGSCANFIGATYQNCKNKYPARRMVLDMVLSGNYTDAQLQAAAAGDHSIYSGSAWDPKSVQIIDYTSQASVGIAESAGLLLPNATRPAAPIPASEAEQDQQQHETAAPVIPDSWQHLRIMHEVDDKADGAPIHNRVLQAASGTSDCVPDDKRASCWCAGKDDGVYPDPAGNKNRYAICAMGTGVLSRCPQFWVFDTTRTRCVHRNEAGAPVPLPIAPGSEIPTPPKSCKHRANGIYFRDSRDITSAYKCDNEVIIPKFCPKHKYLDTATNECKPIPAPVRKNPAPCMDPECFCLDKKDRRYVDVLLHDPQRYITCANGTGAWGTCPDFNQFNPVTRECGFVPPNATEPLADCEAVGCFCIGRADGIYTNPWTDKSGINCESEYSSEIVCEPDYRFEVTASPYCQPRNLAELARSFNARRDRRLLA